MKYNKLTTPQKNIWNLQKYYESIAISNLCGAIFYKDKRDNHILQQAFQMFIRNQTAMRTRFCEKDEPLQYIQEEIDEHIPFRTFSSKEAFDEYAQNFAKTPLGLRDCQMYRYEVFQVRDTSGILVVLSHLISDAWSFGLMAKQVDDAYYKLLGKGNTTLIEADYSDYIQSEEKYLGSSRYVKDKNYWEQKYALRPEESLVKVCPIPTKSITSNRITKKLPMSLEQQLNEYCKTNSATQAVLFKAALFIYLSKINQENNSITVGVPVLNRSNAKEKNIVGMFVSTMPLTMEISGNTVISELIRAITTGHVDMFRHQKYPYSEILKYLREKQNFSGNLYDVMISYQNAQTHSNAETKWYSNGYCEVPLELHIDNRDGQASHTINVDYQTEVFKSEEVNYIMERLEYILCQITADTCETVKDIKLVPEKELNRLINDFNNTYAEYSREKCVHELFTEQAHKTPDKIALVFENKKFTYKELDEMSNSLAHFLRKKGVQPNDVIPIIAKRSWYVIVAMLGILKAGGAYMPVAPDYPKDRIEYMIEIAGSNIALSYGYSENLSIECVDLGEFDYANNVSPITCVNNSKDFCYIVFTSGSTGKPKGVMITHSNVVNYCSSNRYNVCHKIIKPQYESIISVTNIVFDIFVTESLFPLVNGLTVYFASDDEVAMQDRLSSLIGFNRIDVMQTTPTKMRSYILDKKNTEYLRKLKAIILGGEALPMDLYNELKGYTDAHIYNIYGPAETTVWSTNTEVTDDNITIGKPIANTQIYILDKDSTPLPIGVAGELCIAGDGVGKGYLNRPELTAQRFVPNPFATEANRHGKTMYHTGDLARWRVDGEIEYLGRIDTQVKIRGLRIELGEIESVMGTMEGIGLTAVADKRDDNNRQYLVGYYTSDTVIDEKELRKILSSKLPKYMVPNYFMRLESMPMTPSGKTDRKNLPIPDLTSQTIEYVEPVTEVERKLCTLLEELLYMDKLGTNSDFFEYGGDSLTAIEYVAKAHVLGIDFDLQSVFDYPTVGELADFIENGNRHHIQYKSSDFDKYAEIFERNVIDNLYEPLRKPLGNILLTGATGFLGAHVLDELMQNESGKVYCLVRSNYRNDRRGKPYEILQYYFGNKYDSEYGRCIIPIIGDIENDKLSEEMPKDVQTVIHTAASVKHYGSYDYFNRVNVEGTKHVAAYAKSVGAKLIHISTLSVSGNSMADDFTVYRSDEEKHFYETSLYIGQPLDNVYIHSKFEAEKEVYDAMLDGLEAKIIRVGNLTNRCGDYKFQPNYKDNAFLTRVKSILEFGLFPNYLMGLYAEFSPVDMTAKGIVKIAEYADRQCVFHLNSNRPIYFDRFLEILQGLGITMNVVDGNDFNIALEKTAKDNSTEYIYEAFQNDMDEQGRLVYDSNIRIMNDFTEWFMNKVGFEWNTIDLEYIKGYIDYFRNLGYLEV